MRHLYTILMIALFALPAWPARGQDGGVSASAQPPMGSRARQLRLRFALEREATGGSLAMSLDHNREDWETLSPEERDQFRRTAYAFLQKDPEDQEQILQDYARLIRMSAERRRRYEWNARWLASVMETLTPQRRQEIGRMAPADRARVLIQIRDELVADGQIILDPPPPPSE